MHTTLFAAIMAGSTGKPDVSGDRKVATAKKDSGPMEAKPLPRPVPTESAGNPLDIISKR